MNYLIYISSAVKLMSNADLVKILSDSRDNNKTKSITGMLLYGDGVFIQVLEGAGKDIDSVYNKIVKDPRHKSIIQLTSGTLTKRNFPDWTMGFIALNEKELAELDGYINPANKNFLATPNPHAALGVLKTFAQNSKISTHL
jgi:hypothetical protein